MAHRLTLISLPTEVRRQILGYILVVPKDKLIRDTHTKAACEGYDFANGLFQKWILRPKDLCHQGTVPAALLKVCKTLTQIATAILFHHNKFYFTTPQSCHKFITQVSHLARQNSRKVIMQLPTNTFFQIRHLQHLVLPNPLGLHLESTEFCIPDRWNTHASANFSDSFYRFVKRCLEECNKTSTLKKQITEATIRHLNRS